MVQPALFRITCTSETKIDSISNQLTPAAKDCDIGLIPPGNAAVVTCDDACVNVRSAPGMLLTTSVAALAIAASRAAWSDLLGRPRFVYLGKRNIKKSHPYEFFWSLILSSNHQEK